MDRTESTVVQVAPDYENLKIKEMEQFGWNLQGRQEIHEEGDAYGRPSYIDKTEYIVKIKVHNYVKLHFARSLSLPNLNKIRALEAQYNSIPYPDFPKMAPGGCLLLLFWYPFWPLWYFLGYKPRRAQAEAKLAEVFRQHKEIFSQAKALLGG